MVEEAPGFFLHDHVCGVIEPDQLFAGRGNVTEPLCGEVVGDVVVVTAFEEEDGASKVRSGVEIDVFERGEELGDGEEASVVDLAEVLVGVVG